jgi:hypothetical protein
MVSHHHFDYRPHTTAPLHQPSGRVCMYARVLGGRAGARTHTVRTARGRMQREYQREYRSYAERVSVEHRVAPTARCCGTFSGWAVHVCKLAVSRPPSSLRGGQPTTSPMQPLSPLSPPPPPRGHVPRPQVLVGRDWQGSAAVCTPCTVLADDGRNATGGRGAGGCSPQPTAHSRRSYSRNSFSGG